MRLSYSLGLGVGLGLFLLTPGPAAAVEREEITSVAPRQVGGLLFDFDEGVDIEQGPGGSVYVKSNREVMQQKFRDIEKRFEELEDRMTQIEKTAVLLPEEEAESTQDETNSPQPRVLST